MPSAATMYQTQFNYAIDQSDLLWTPVGGLGSQVGYYIEGTDAGETLYGSQYADDIYGLGGNDILYGQGGNDRLFGGLGDDSLHGGLGADVMDGGAGTDTVSYTGSAAVTVDLRDRGFGGQAEGDTYFNIENVFGSSFGDVLLGNADNNTLSGWDGNDQLFGDFGNDTLKGDVGHDRLDGGFGNDTLIGGAGNDTLSGGDGSDTFVFGPSSDDDRILDFQIGVDKIALDVQGTSRNPSADVFDNNVFGRDGQLAQGFFRGDGTFSGTGLDGADDVIYLTNTNQLISVEELFAVNGHWTVRGAELLATLNTDVSTSDFILI
jgi:Ca2+-binding RTX toxin-like protein